MTGNKNLWQFRVAKKPKDRQRFVLGILVVGGISSIVRFADWWFREEHIKRLLFFVLLSIFFWYGILRLMIVWISYLRINSPEPARAPKGLGAAIFTTSPTGEPPSMIEKPLEACPNI